VTRWASCWLAIAISAAAFSSATAQQPAKVFRIGILSPAAEIAIGSQHEAQRFTR